MTKRRLTAIRLDKIAAVDKPCQEHAIVAIVKRAPGGPVPPAIAKKSFDEALRAQLISEKVGDVFWRAFENQWAVREAFRTAMTDEIAEGADGSESIAGFTAAMEQIATLAAEAAREAANTAEPNLEAAVETAISKWLNEQEQPMHKYITKAALQSAISTFAIAKATAQDVADIKESAVALNETGLLPADGVLAITVTAAPTASPELAKALQEIEVLKMAPNIRKHYDGLDEAGKTAFIAKDAAGRSAEVDAIEKGDPILHTTADGIEIRKSDGAAALALAKSNDALRADVAKLRTDGTAASIEKRLIAYPNVAKGTATDMLKTADALGVDTDAGKAVIKSLDQMNKASSGLFKSLGTTSVTDGGEGGGTIEKARQTFYGKVTEIAKRDSISRADAMSKARSEFADLHAEAYPAPAEEEA